MPAKHNQCASSALCCGLRGPVLLLSRIHVVRAMIRDMEAKTEDMGAAGTLDGCFARIHCLCISPEASSCCHVPLCQWLCTFTGFVAEGNNLARLVRLSECKRENPAAAHAAI